MQTEILLNTIQDGVSKPSFLEVIFIDQTDKLIKPAVRHLALFIAEAFHLDIVVEQFENLFCALMFSVQWRSLELYDSFISESMYGVNRRSIINGAEQKLSNRQKLLSLLFSIVLPRIVAYFRDLSAKIRSRLDEESLRDSRSIQQSSGNNQNLFSLVQTAFRSTVSLIEVLFARGFPIVDLLGDLSVASSYLLFLNGSSYHHPLFALLGMTLAKRKYNKSASPTVEIEDGGISRSNETNQSRSSWSVAIILTVVLSLRALEYIRNSQSLINSHHVARRVADEVPLPSPPPQPRIYPGSIVPPSDSSICSLCKKSRTNPCAANSGYVFCYICILNYVRSNRCCPVTKIPCLESDLIRLYENFE